MTVPHRGTGSAKSPDERPSRDMGHLWDERDTGASTKKSATNAPIAPAAGNASQRAQRPQRETRHKPAKPASGAGAEERNRKKTSGARANERAPKGPALKRLTNGSNGSRMALRRTHRKRDKGDTN